ncbi:MAG: hypothetical protein GX817_03710 [Elusimicrobia bacterium]|nr:hypothetical protein [Elusimicrobiota bacterium]
MTQNPNLPLQNGTQNDSEKKGESTCPACGYFAGVEATCVRCGARVEKNIAVRTVRIIAVIGSIVGIILLWIAAYMKIPPVIAIGEISEPMNNALVEIIGNVARIDYVENDNTFRMTISDGTGQIRLNAINRLRAFREVHGDNMPEHMDKVSVIGTLNISQAWGNSMFLSIPDRLKVLEKFTLQEVAIADLKTEDEGKHFLIDAKIHAYREIPTRSGGILRSITLSDGTGYIDLPLFDSQFDALSSTVQSALVKKGTGIRLQAKVGVFRDQPQLELVEPENPEFLIIK